MRMCEISIASKNHRNRIRNNSINSMNGSRMVRTMLRTINDVHIYKTKKY